MSSGPYVALSGALAQSVALETTSANLANASTVGYQKVRPVFTEALSRAREAGVPVRGTAVSRTALDSARGALRSTGRPLDVALSERVYLAVSTPAGERYTRAGALRVGEDGTLKTASGLPVIGADDQPIAIGKVHESTLSVRPDGQVFRGEAPVGRIKLVEFERVDGLTHESGGTVAAAPDAPRRTVSAGLEVGVLEESNTAVVTAMTELVSATRTFEAFQRTLDAFRDADRTVVSRVPSPG